MLLVQNQQLMLHDKVTNHHSTTIIIPFSPNFNPYFSCEPVQLSSKVFVNKLYIINIFIFFINFL